MVFIRHQQWVIIVFVQLLIKHASVQMMYPPPMMAMPVPHPIPVAIAVPVAVEVSTTSRTTTTSTTTERAIAYGVAVPVPMPMPVQVAVPAAPPPMFCQGSPRPRGCPPCPPCVCVPSCTPAFFSYCSPCHQKCRCRSASDAPAPQPPTPPPPAPGAAFPMPVPGPGFLPMAPPPVLMVPFPPIRQLPQPPRGHRPRPRPRPRRRPRPRTSSDCSSSSSDTSTSDSTDTSSSSEWYTRRKRKHLRNGRKGKRNRQIMRRNLQSEDISDGELVKPVLTYVSNNGEIKIKRKITDGEAADLLDDNEVVAGLRSQKYKIQSGNGRGEALFVSETSDEDIGNNVRKTNVVLKKGGTGHVLSKGKKQLIFRPPTDKQITNLSVSFQVV